MAKPMHGFPYPRLLMSTFARWVRGLEPAVADAVLAVALAIVLGGLTLLAGAHNGYRHTGVLAAVLAVFASLALAARRRAPLATLLVTLSLMAVYEARGYTGSPALIAPLVALYTVANADRRARALALGVLTGAVLVAARVSFTSEPLSTAVTYAVGFVSAALFLGWAVANHRAYLEEVRDRAERAERMRIARELHDAVAHSIATINVQAGVAAHVIESRPEQANEALVSIKQTSKQALRELREILGILRQDDEPQPRSPVAGLDHLDELLEACRRGDVNVELEIEGDQSRLPVAVDLAAYRILQESLTNVIRHAAPATAHVRIAYMPTRVHLSIDDDGGRSSNFAEGSGHGIVGMRERAQTLGGTLFAGPRPAGGFEVSASLPLSGEPRA